MDYYSGFPKGKNFTCIAEDRQGRIWAGTDDSGVAVFNGREWKMVILMCNLANTDVVEIKIQNLLSIAHRNSCHTKLPVSHISTAVADRCSGRNVLHISHMTLKFHNRLKLYNIPLHLRRRHDFKVNVSYRNRWGRLREYSTGFEGDRKSVV